MVIRTQSSSPTVLAHRSWPSLLVLSGHSAVFHSSAPPNKLDYAVAVDDFKAERKRL